MSVTTITERMPGDANTEAVPRQLATAQRSTAPSGSKGSPVRGERRWSGDSSPRRSPTAIAFSSTKRRHRNSPLVSLRFVGVFNPKGLLAPQNPPKRTQRIAVLRELKEIFQCSRCQPVHRVIAPINPTLRGWVTYFPSGARAGAPPLSETGGTEGALERFLKAESAARTRPQTIA